MNRKRLFPSAAMLAANLLFVSQAYVEELSSAPPAITGRLQAVGASSSAARRTGPRMTAMRASLGAMDTREDSVDLADLGEDFSKLHLAAGATITFDIPSRNPLALALDSEVWVTVGSYRGADLTTVPILFGLRAAMFSSSPVRLYGIGGAGLCIIRTSVTTVEVYPLPPFIFSNTEEEEIDCSFTYAVGGGIEFIGARRRRLFSVDYRYLVAGSEGSLGGHLLCISYGFLF
jgi:hypothetical protein